MGSFNWFNPENDKQLNLFQKITVWIFRIWTVLLIVEIVDFLGRSIWSETEPSGQILNITWWTWLVLFLVFAWVARKKRE